MLVAGLPGSAVALAAGLGEKAGWACPAAGVGFLLGKDKEK